jgi:hypothetical protein
MDWWINGLVAEWMDGWEAESRDGLNGAALFPNNPSIQ